MKFDPYPFPRITIGDIEEHLRAALPKEQIPRAIDTLYAQMPRPTYYPRHGEGGGDHNYDQPWRQYVRAVLFSRDDNKRRALESVDFVRAWIGGHDLVVTRDSQHRFLEGLALLYRAAERKGMLRELRDEIEAVSDAHCGHVEYAANAKIGAVRDRAQHWNQRIASRLIGSCIAVGNVGSAEDAAFHQWNATWQQRDKGEGYGWGMDADGVPFCGDQFQSWRHGSPLGKTRHIPYQAFQFQATAMHTALANGVAPALAAKRLGDLRAWFRERAYVDHDNDLRRGTGPTQPVDILDAGGRVQPPGYFQRIAQATGAPLSEKNPTGEMLYPYYQFFDRDEVDAVHRVLRATVAQCLAYWPGQLQRALFAPELANWIARNKGEA